MDQALETVSKKKNYYDYEMLMDRHFRERNYLLEKLQRIAMHRQLLNVVVRSLIMSMDQMHLNSVEEERWVPMEDEEMVLKVQI